MIKVCCVCGKVERRGEWVKEKGPVRQGSSHVYCPFCYEELMDDIDRYILQRWSKSVYTVINTGQLQEA